MVSMMDGSTTEKQVAMVRRHKDRIDERDRRGRTALFFAVQRLGTSDLVIDELLKAGANPICGSKPPGCRVPGHKKISPLMLVLVGQDVDRAERMWPYRPFVDRSPPDNLWTEDSTAPEDGFDDERQESYFGWGDSFTFLLQRDAFLSVRWLAEKVEPSAVAVRLAPEIPTPFHPLAVALRRHDYSSVELFLKIMRKHAIPVPRKWLPVDEAEKSPARGGNWLHLFASEGNYPALALACERLGLSDQIDETNKEGMTPIMLAAAIASADCVLFLATKRADLSIRYKPKSVDQSFTAFELASKSKEICRLPPPCVRALDPNGSLRFVPKGRVCETTL